MTEILSGKWTLHPCVSIIEHNDINPNGVICYTPRLHDIAYCSWAQPFHDALLSFIDKYKTNGISTCK